MGIPQRAPLSCILKLKRAAVHYNTLKKEVEYFLNTEPDSPIFNFESDTTENVIRVRILKPLPPDWSVLVGDCLYNLRSGLDHLISITVGKKGAPTNRTEFPIFIDPDKYAKVNKRGCPAIGSGLIKVAGLCPTAQAYIESIQPYNRLDDPPDLHPLWLLHEISNHDKHRMVDLVHASFGKGYVTVESPGSGKVERFDLPKGALEDGAVVVHLRPILGVRREPQVKVNFKFTPGVAFSTEGPGRGLPVLRTLAEINNFINSIIESFQPFIK